MKSTRLKPIGKTFKLSFLGKAAASGMTLMELLVVVVIIVVLAAAGFPLMRNAMEASKAATCVSNLRQLGMGLLMHANDHNQKLIPLQPALNPETGKRPPIWPAQLAQAGYLWDGSGELPCGSGIWTCPQSDFMSHAYGGYGVVEGAIFVYEENRPSGGVRETGSLRLGLIDRPENTWLVGDACKSPETIKKGWYAIWSSPGSWKGHGPAERHRGKVNVCMVDGRVVALTRKEIEAQKLTFDVVR